MAVDGFPMQVFYEGRAYPAPHRGGILRYEVSTGLQLTVRRDFDDRISMTLERGERQEYRPQMDAIHLNQRGRNDMADALAYMFHKEEPSIREQMTAREVMARHHKQQEEFIQTVKLHDKLMQTELEKLINPPFFMRQNIVLEPKTRTLAFDLGINELPPRQPGPAPWMSEYKTLPEKYKEHLVPDFYASAAAASASAAASVDAAAIHMLAQKWL